MVYTTHGQHHGCFIVVYCDNTCVRYVCIYSIATIYLEPIHWSWSRSWAPSIDHIHDLEPLHWSWSWAPPLIMIMSPSIDHDDDLEPLHWSWSWSWAPPLIIIMICSHSIDHCMRQSVVTEWRMTVQSLYSLLRHRARGLEDYLGSSRGSSVSRSHVL